MPMRCPAVLFLWISGFVVAVFSFSGAVGKVRKIGSFGDFADSLAVFAAPKRIGLKSHIRLSAVPIHSSSITSPDASTHLRPG
jgi:hypothetical protein